MLTVNDLRPEVIAFALLMEQKLRANDHKGGWKMDHPQRLVERVFDEAKELRDAVGIGHTNVPNIVLEAADVANMAMMVADVCGGLPTSSYPKPCSACFGSGLSPKAMIAPPPPDMPCMKCGGRGY